MNYPCLRDYIKDDNVLIDCVGAIFSTIGTLSTNIFTNYDTELISEMAYTYYYERAERPLKVLYWKYCENAVDWEDDTSVSAFFAHIAKVAYSRYGSNWEKIYSAYFLTEYKPLNNYDMTQVRTPNLTTDTDLDRKQDTNVTTGSTQSTVPFNETTPTQTGATTGSSETTEESAKNHIDTTTTETGTDTLTREGNIGITSSQMLLTSELELRKYDFWARVFKDIDSVILRSYWG